MNVRCFVPWYVVAEPVLPNAGVGSQLAVIDTTTWVSSRWPYRLPPGDKINSKSSTTNALPLWISYSLNIISHWSTLVAGRDTTFDAGTISNVWSFLSFKFNVIMSATVPSKSKVRRTHISTRIVPLVIFIGRLLLTLYVPLLLVLPSLPKCNTYPL